MDYSLLIASAFEAMEYAYAPYSHFKVGAALLGKSGKIYNGCNVENASFGAGVCAERNAIQKAVSEGEKNFVAIAVTGGINGNVSDYVWPCGICRQVMSEFCRKDFDIISAKSEDDFLIEKLSDLIPCSFSSDKIL